MDVGYWLRNGRWKDGYLQHDPQQISQAENVQGRSGIKMVSK